MHIEHLKLQCHKTTILHNIRIMTRNSNFQISNDNWAEMKPNHIFAKKTMHALSMLFDIYNIFCRYRFVC